MDRLGHPSIFNCSICSQPYSSRHTLNKGGKVPLVLNCGHSACDSCITRLINKSGDSLTCQICKNVSKASENYNASKPELEFPQNSVILGKLVQKSQSGWDDHKISFTVQAKPQKSPRTVQCHECDERRAELNCAQCQVPYCNICFNRVHQSAKAFKDHVAMDLAALANIETKCSVHNQILQFWCEPCSAALCSSCIISTHTGHKVSLLVDKNTGCFKDFLDAFTRVSNVQARLQATRKKAASSLSKLETCKYKDVEHKLREHFSRLHGLLITRENNLLKLLYSPSRGSANSLKNMLQQIDLSIEDLDGELDASASLIEYDTKYLSCTSYMDALHRLHVKQTTPCFLVVSSENKDSSTFMFEEDIFEKLVSHGQIDVSNDVPIYRLLTEEQLPEDYTIDPIKALSLDSVIKAHKSFSSESKSGSRCSLSPAASNLSLSSNSQPEHVPGPRGGAQAAETSSNDSFNRNFDELVEGCKVKVIMTHATSPNDFYVRRLGLERKLMEINQMFSKLHLKTPAQDRVRIGDYYMAQFTQDNRWYRSVVTQVDGNLITVFYIDFGNKETVKRESLRLIPQTLMKYDGMAVHCSLHDCIPLEGTRWTPQTITTMLKITDNCNGDLTMSIFRRAKDMLYVDLLRSVNLDTVSLRKALIFLNLARPSNSTSPRLQIDNVSNQRPLPQSKIYDNGYVTDVTITHCVSPDEFYIHDNKNSNTTKQLTAGLHEMYSKKSERSIVYHPKIGMTVAAMNGNDNEWRRAKITAVPDYKKVQVLYLDFGNSEVISYKRLRYLGHKFFKIGIQCYKCRLMDIKPLEDKWSGAAEERFAALVQHLPNIGVAYPEKDKAKMSLVVHSLQGDTYNTVLYRDQGKMSLCINAALVQENVAVSTGPSSSLLEIPSKINEDSIPRARRFSKERSQSGRGAGRLRDLEEGSQELADVRAILMARSMPPMPDVHQSMPSLSHPQYQSSSSYLGDSCASLILPDKLNESAAVKPLKAKPKEMGSADSYVGKPTVPDSPEEPIKLPVRIVKVVSPSEFYITPVSLISKLELLKSSMQAVYSWVDKRKNLVDIIVGSVCVTKRVAQGDWCRAVVVNLLDDAAEVRLPDYGDVLTVKLEELFTIEEKFLEVRDGATRCHLGGLKQPLEDRWPMTSTDEIIEFADKYDGKIYITKLGEERANSLPVEVLMREEVTAGALEPTRVTWTSLNNNLRMRGLALADGTIDWNIEDFKFVSVQQQKPRLKIDVFKGIPIEYAGVANTSQVENLEEILNAESIFGSGLKVTDGEESDYELVTGDSLSRLALSDSNQPVTGLVDSLTDDPLSNFQVVTPQAGLPIPVPVMPKAWLPPLPFSKLEFLANPTNVNNDAAIFLQEFQKSISSLKRISEILDSHCRMSLPMGHDMYWSVDQTCIARYHLDQKWYRGVVKSIKEDNTLMVELVDYGNVEECSVTDLRKMPLAEEYPIQGQFCHLNRLKPNTATGKWTIPVLDKMHALVVEKHCLVKLSVNDSDHSYSIENIKLPDGSEMLASLVKEGVAVYDETPCHRPCSVPMTTLLPPEASCSTSALEVIEIISETDLTKPDSTHITQASKDSEGESDIRTKSWVEQCEELLESEDQITYIPVEQHLQVAMLPLTVSQQQVAMPSDCASLSESDATISDHTGPIGVAQHNQTYEPDFYLLYTEFPKNLSRFEVEVLDVFVGFPDVISFHVTNSIDLQLSNSRERFLEFSKTLQVEAPLQPLVQLPHRNDLCCAEFSDDKLWYRALILDVPDEQHVIVKYVDYGNMEQLPLSKIREMKEEWSIIEVQLLNARLHNLEVSVPEDKWHCVKYLFQEVLLDRKLTAVVIEHEPELTLELFNGDKLAYQTVIDSGFFKPKNN